MKAWFFYSTEKGSKGRWNSAYEVMIQKDGCMTFGSTLWEAVYMAHDLVACVTEGYGDCGEIRWVEDYEKELAELGVSSDGYCGMMDIDLILQSESFCDRICQRLHETMKFWEGIFWLLLRKLLLLQQRRLPLPRKL